MLGYLRSRQAVRYFQLLGVFHLNLHTANIDYRFLQKNSEFYSSMSSATTCSAKILSFLQKNKKRVSVGEQASFKQRSVWTNKVDNLDEYPALSYQNNIEVYLTRQFTALDLLSDITKVGFKLILQYVYTLYIILVKMTLYAL